MNIKGVNNFIENWYKKEVNNFKQKIKEHKQEIERLQKKIKVYNRQKKDIAQ